MLIVEDSHNISGGSMSNKKCIFSNFSINFSDFSIIENIYYKKVGKPYARLWIKDEVV